LSLNLVRRIARAARLLATGKLALSTGFDGAQMQRRLVACRGAGRAHFASHDRHGAGCWVTAIVNDTTWSTIVGTWQPACIALYVDSWLGASSTAATNTSALFGIYRWGWGFSTSQDLMATSR
jgi:hypothetical protein